MLLLNFQATGHVVYCVMFMLQAVHEVRNYLFIVVSGAGVIERLLAAGYIMTLCSMKPALLYRPLEMFSVSQ